MNDDNTPSDPEEIPRSAWPYMMRREPHLGGLADLDELAARMTYFSITDYEVRNGVVYWRGQDIGSVAYLNSRSMEQLAGILDRARSQAKGESKG